MIGEGTVTGASSTFSSECSSVVLRGVGVSEPRSDSGSVPGAGAAAAAAAAGRWWTWHHANNKTAAAAEKETEARSGG